MSMNEKEVLAIMASDMKLWEAAQTNEDSKTGTLTKSIVLPWGIGEYSVTFKGVNTSDARRAAVSQFGIIVRDRIKEQIDDEAVTARAQQAAAKARTQDNRVHGSTSRATSLGTEGLSIPGTSTSFEENAEDFGATLRSRISGLERDIQALIDALQLRQRSYRALVAALREWEDFNAPEDSSKTTEDSGREGSTSGDESSGSNGEGQ